MKPSITSKTVYINWSESNELNTGEVYPFTEFEKKALSIALTNPLGGYDKTNVTVTFSDNSQHQCRLDLGCMGNDLGFNEHCLSILNHHAKNKENPNMPWMRESHQLEMIALISTYQLNADLAYQVRKKAQQTTEKEKEKQEAERQEKLEQQRQKEEAHRKQEEAFRQNLSIPDWAKSAIIATYTVCDTERSDSYQSEYYTITKKCIILAWSKNSQQRISEMRKACLNHPDTAFLYDEEQSRENRENHPMGDGNYLTDRRYSFHGWRVYKHRFWDKNNKAKHLPMGELTALTDGTNQ